MEDWATIGVYQWGFSILGVDVPSAGQCVWFRTQGTWTETDLEIELQ